MRIVPAGSGLRIAMIGAVIGVVVAAMWSVALVTWDIRHQRLPNLLTLPAAVVAICVSVFHPVGWWGLVWPVAYFILGKGIGGGDVKLAVPLGVGVALAGGLAGVLLAMLLSSALTLAILLGTKRTVTAHGPSMVAAAWLVGLWCVRSCLM